MGKWVRNNVALATYRYLAVRDNIAVCKAKQYRAPKVHIAFTNGEHIPLDVLLYAFGLKNEDFPTKPPR